MSNRTILVSSFIVLIFFAAPFAAMICTSADNEANHVDDDEYFTYSWVDEDAETVAISSCLKNSETTITIPEFTKNTHKIVGIMDLAFKNAKCTKLILSENLEFIESHCAYHIETFGVPSTNAYFSVYGGSTDANGMVEGPMILTKSGTTVVAAGVTAADILKDNVFPGGITTIGEGAYLNVDFSGAFDGKELRIPDTVKTIEDYGFEKAVFQKNGRHISALTIPDSVILIGKEAFYGNKMGEDENCTNVTIGNGVYCIGEKAFYGRNFFSGELKVNALMILDEAFAHCHGFDSFVLGSNVAYIGVGAFSNSGVKGDIVIPSTVDYVGPGAFMNCKSIKSLDIDSAVIGGDTNKGAFMDCTGLESVKIGKNVLIIGDYAFAGCKYMKCERIDFSADLEYIGDCAFEGCNCLDGTTFAFHNEPRAIGYHAFNINGTVIIESDGWAEQKLKGTSVFGVQTDVQFVTASPSSGNSGDNTGLIIGIVVVIIIILAILGYLYFTRWRSK